MENKFQLVSNFNPSGDQPKAIEKLSQGFLSGKRRLTLTGVTGSGKTYTMASFIRNIGRPTLVITHNKTLAAQLYREFREFFPHNAVEYFVSYYDYYQPEAYVPSSDTYIEKDASVNDEIDRLRLRATSALLERRDTVIVASVSCIYGLGSPEEYRESIVMLDRGLELDRDTVIRSLLHIRYERNDMDFSRGNFRVRGDTLEIFPAYKQEGIRIEWFGDEIENLSYFDPLTGKVLDRRERIVVYPAKHFITSPPRLKEACEAIERELAEQLQVFKQKNKPLEAERLEMRTRYDLEMLREMGYCNGIENYSRHLSGRAPGEPPACLLNYFPEEFMVIIDESHVTLPQVRGMYAGDRSRKQTLVERGSISQLTVDDRPLNFEEFEARTPDILFVSATPADYEQETAELHAEQVIRPTGLLDPVVEVRPVRNQIEDLLGEIRARVESDERTLVTTLTKKMAEDLADYLQDMDIKVVYLHSEVDTIKRVEIIRDLRKGIHLPEVSLVAILDADKEGFLRNARSLIQTMGRAARNVNAKAILYADKVTPSMETAIQETERRRTIQADHNEKHNIRPETIRKEIHDIIEREGGSEHEEALLTELERELKLDEAKGKREKVALLRNSMLAAAANMEFEKAALLRDKLLSLEGKSPASAKKKAPVLKLSSKRRSRKPKGGK